MGEPAGPTLVIGWREHVRLPSWGIARILAKADTGAATSAVHAENIEVSADGVLAFDVVYARPRGREAMTRRVRAEAVRRVTVRSSSGAVSTRWVVRTDIELSGVRRTIEVTLINRDPMRCRMLLGRESLAGAFVVDAGRSFVVSDREAIPGHRDHGVGGGLS